MKRFDLYCGYSRFEEQRFKAIRDELRMNERIRQIAGSDERKVN